MNSDEYIRTINTRFPPPPTTTTSNRISNTINQKSSLSPHRDTLKFTYVTSMRQRTSSVASSVTNTSTIPEAPPLPIALGTLKQKTPWPLPSPTFNNHSLNTLTSNNQSESLNNSTNEIRRRKISSSDSKSSRKESDLHQQQQSFDSSDNSIQQSPTATSSIHFIQRTLNQHALKAIAKGRLRHLGYMAANIVDFDLLNWLQTHKY